MLMGLVALLGAFQLSELGLPEFLRLSGLLELLCLSGLGLLPECDLFLEVLFLIFSGLSSEESCLARFGRFGSFSSPWIRCRTSRQDSSTPSVSGGFPSAIGSTRPRLTAQMNASVV